MNQVQKCELGELFITQWYSEKILWDASPSPPTPRLSPHLWTTETASLPSCPDPGSAQLPVLLGGGGLRGGIPVKVKGQGSMRETLKVAQCLESLLRMSLFSKLCLWEFLSQKQHFLPWWSSSFCLPKLLHSPHLDLMFRKSSPGEAL